MTVPGIWKNISRNFLILTLNFRQTWHFDNQTCISLTNLTQLSNSILPILDILGHEAPLKTKWQIWVASRYPHVLPPSGGGGFEEERTGTRLRGGVGGRRGALPGGYGEGRIWSGILESMHSGSGALPAHGRAGAGSFPGSAPWRPEGNPCPGVSRKYPAPAIPQGLEHPNRVPPRGAGLQLPRAAQRAAAWRAPMLTPGADGNLNA